MISWPRRVMALLSFVLWLETKICRADGNLPNLDQGMELYREFNQKMADDPEQATQEALDLFKAENKPPISSQFLQIYGFMLINAAEKIPPEWKGLAPMQRMMARAQELGNSALALQLEFKIKQDQLPASEEQSDALGLLMDKYITLAKSQNHLRLAVGLLLAKSFYFYNAGDMKKALVLAQEAFRLLDKNVSADDFQLIQVKSHMATFLEYSGDRVQAERVYQEVIAAFQKKSLRWAVADVTFNYGLLLMHNKKFFEAQKAYKLVEATGISLQSKLLQGRALKGLGYAQAATDQNRLAIDSYNKSIALMKEAKEDPVAIVDTYKLLAMIYNHEQQWEKAIQALEIAEKDPTAMQDKSWERSLQEQRMEAYTGLGKYAEAMRAAKRITQLYDEISKAEQENELGKLKVSMGLQLEEQRTNVLKEQNKLQQDKLLNAEVLRRVFFAMMGLSVLVILLLLVALRQTLRAKKSRERVHRILEHIEEGILSIGAGMKVEADLSPYLARLLGLGESTRKAEDMFKNLLEVADLQADERATIRSALSACLGEDVLSWDLNQAQLPIELSIQNGAKQLSLEWQPLYGDGGLIQSVLITVRDITAKRKLQNEVVEAKAHASRLEQRLSDILQIDARAAEAFVNEVSQILPGLRPKIEHNRDLAQCYRQLHTLKGMARSLGFKEMSSLVHHMEDQLDLEHKVVKQRAEALHILDEIEQTVHEYSEIIQKVYFRQSEAAGTKAVSLLDLVATSIVPVRSMLERTGLELAQVDVHDHVSSWSREWLDVVQVMLLHGMTNSADHGFILPCRRGLAIEKKASLQISAWQTLDALYIELKDNGVGLDYEQLGRLAERLGFVPEPHETLADVVFLDGASTAEQVSTSSGRGMGMAAVRAEILALHGTVNFRSNPSGHGSSLMARLPLPTAKAA